MNLDRIITESINNFINENMPLEKESPKKWKYGVSSVNVSDKPKNNYEKTANAAKKKGEIAQLGDEQELVDAITADGVNTTQICRDAGYPNPNNKASAVDKVANGKTWGNGSKAHLRQSDISKLTQSAQKNGINI